MKIFLRQDREPIENCFSNISFSSIYDSSYLDSDGWQIASTFRENYNYIVQHLLLTCIECKLFFSYGHNL